MPPFYRIDKFAVPAHGRDEFLDKVNKTHALLRAQPGFVRDYILESQPEASVSDVLTFVEWESAGVVKQVAQTVAQFHKEIGFDRSELLRRLGISAEFGSYAPSVM